MKPFAIDLCCGLGGWTEGLLAEGYRVRGYDIEAHEYDGEKYPAELVLQSILDLNGADCAEADLIVASPPCQEYSYMAMPWSRAKAKAAAIRADETGEALERLNALFNACFRIQHEASQAAGRHIPMVVENVRGAQPWVGRARWNFGSYYLWGDLPALMPIALQALKVPALDGTRRTDPGKGARFTSRDCGDEGRKNPGFRFDGSGGSFQTASVEHHELGGRKNTGGSWFKIGSPGQVAVNNNPDGRQWKRDPVASCGSKSPKRKAASAKIAKIPLTLSQHIARHYLPQRVAA